MWTISNFISLSRMILAIPMAALLMSGQNISALILGLLACGTDMLDGYLARKLNQVSEYGKIIDPLADKVFIGTVAICMLLSGMVPLWFVIAIVLRDVLILMGGIYAKGKVELVIPSNYVGKITVIILALVMGGVLINIHWFADYGLFVALGALIVSLTVYSYQMFDKIKSAEKKDIQR
jgi:cardiolipin synthase (CMP-forming)